MADTDTKGTPAPEASDTYAAELDAFMKSGSAEPDTKPADEAVEDTDAETHEAEDLDADEEVEAAADGEEDAEADADDDAEEDLDADESKEDEQDIKYSAALNKVQKERRSFDAYKKAENAKLDQRANELKAAETQLKTYQAQFQKFARDIQADPVRVLAEENLINEDNGAYIAKQLWLAYGPDSKDPKLAPGAKAEADRLRRERQAQVEAKSVRDELEQFRREQDQARKEAQTQAALNNYLASIDQAVTATKAKSQLLTQALEKSATKTKQELQAIAEELSVAQNELAAPETVIKEWIKRRKVLMSELGVTPPVAKPKAKSQPAAKKQGQQTAPTNKDTPAKSYEQELEEFMRR